MDRIKRNERIGVMTRVLTSSPNKLFSLTYFCELFGLSKSTVSEDIDILTDSLKAFDLGELRTFAGAAGGVVYRPIVSRARAVEALSDIAARLSQPGRLLPGDFLYTTDITCDSALAQCMGEILAQQYYDAQPDFVLTMETKGIPVAMMTARALNAPLVIARRDSRAYEGSAVKINYVSGSSAGGLETMTLARRAVAPGRRALIIDDFMKGGGTLLGMHDLMKEFSAQVVGTGVVIATASPEKKRVRDVCALLVLHGVDRESGRAFVEPSEWLRH